MRRYSKPTSAPQHPTTGWLVSSFSCHPSKNTLISTLTSLVAFLKLSCSAQRRIGGILLLSLKTLRRFFLPSQVPLGTSLPTSTTSSLQSIKIFSIPFLESLTKPGGTTLCFVR